MSKPLPWMYFLSSSSAAAVQHQKQYHGCRLHGYYEKMSISYWPHKEVLVASHHRWYCTSCFDSTRQFFSCIISLGSKGSWDSSTHQTSRCIRSLGIGSSTSEARFSLIVVIIVDDSLLDLRRLRKWLKEGNGCNLRISANCLLGSIILDTASSVR